MALNYIELLPKTRAMFSENIRKRLEKLAAKLPENYRIPRNDGPSLQSDITHELGAPYTHSMLRLDSSILRTGFKYLNATESNKQSIFKRVEADKRGPNMAAFKLLAGLRADSVHTWNQLLERAAKTTTRALALNNEAETTQEEAAAAIPAESYEPEPVETRLAAVGEELVLLAGELAGALRSEKARAASLEAQIRFLTTSLADAEDRALKAREEALGAYAANLEEIASNVPENRALLEAAMNIKRSQRQTKGKRARMGLPLRFVWKGAAGRIEYGEHFIDRLDDLEAVDRDRVKGALARFAKEGPYYPSFRTEKVKRDHAIHHSPAQSQKSRLSDELRMSWTHPAANHVIVHFMWRKGENVGLGESEA